MIRDDMYSVEGLAVVIYFKKTLVVNAFDQFISPRFTWCTKSVIYYFELNVHFEWRFVSKWVEVVLLYLYLWL